MRGDTHFTDEVIALVRRSGKTPFELSPKTFKDKTVKAIALVRSSGKTPFELSLKTFKDKTIKAIASSGFALLAMTNKKPFAMTKKT